MATATAFTPLNMDAWVFWDTTDLPILESTHIQETGLGGRVQDYYGVGFTGDLNAGVTGGTLTSTTYTLLGVQQYTVSGLNHSAVTAYNYIYNDNPAILPYLFGGSDTFNGSSGNDVVNGYSGNDVLYGNGGNDTLRGNDGNDVLNGGLGNDIMSGGTGGDTYVVDSIGDSVQDVSGASGGIDTVHSSVNFDLLAPGPGLADQNLLENLVLTGSAVEGWGNNLNNTLTGNSGHNSLNGDPGNDNLNGGGGNDTLNGGLGNDLMTGGAGHDRFDWDASQRAGNDTMRGGTGNDTYVISGIDQVIENSGEGIDLIWAQQSYFLTPLPYVENLSLIGTANIHATGNNILSGGDGNDTLNGGVGNDTLNGGTGADRLNGGDGTDTLVWNAADVSVNGAAGADTLRIDGAGQTLNLLTVISTKIQNVEVINLTGSGNNRLELSLQDVLDLSSTTNTLRVDGNAGDTVDRNAGWVTGGIQLIGASFYRSYTQGAAVLLVDTDITVTT